MTRLRVTRAQSLLAAAVLTLTVPQSPAQFEGVVETKNVSTDEYGRAISFTMTMWIAPAGVRIGIPATGENPGVTIIGRTDRPVRWVLNDLEKTYFELPLEQPRDDDARPVESAGFQRTGKKKKILGFNAEQLLLTSGTMRTEIWATGDLKALVETLEMALGDRGVESGGAWGTELTRAGLFPLRALTKDGASVLESSDVTRIRRERVDLRMLELPPDYRRQGVQDVIREETDPEP
jgi:hypothetical protein